MVTINLDTRVSRCPLTWHDVNTSFIGKGVDMYIVDSGIDLGHRGTIDHRSKQPTTPAILTTYRLEFDVRIQRGWSSIARTVQDENNHGSHVAGIAAGVQSGVAKEATIIPVRVLNKHGDGDFWDVIQALNWIARRHRRSTRPSVVNMSIGGRGSKGLDDAIKHLNAAGVIIVAAAGNDNDDACNYSPARSPYVITVGATNRRDQRAPFSNYGRCVNIMAPGTGINSASVNKGYTTMDGTSLAAPYVAGVAALYLEKIPELTTGRLFKLMRAGSLANALDRRSLNSTPNLLLQTTMNPFASFQ